MDFKRTLKAGGTLIALVLLNACANVKSSLPTAARNLPSHRMAVLPFKGDAHFSEEMSSVLVTELLGHGYRVVERAELLNVLNEQNLQYTGAVDPKTITENGKLCGADYIVIGSIQTRQVVPAVDWILGTGGAVTRVESVNVRWVSVRSGEIVASACIRNGCFGNMDMTGLASRIVDSVNIAIQSNPQA